MAATGGVRRAGGRGIPAGAAWWHPATAATAATAPAVGATSMVAVAAFSGAIVGDVIGHTLGRRYGTRLLARGVLRRTRRPVLRARLLMRNHAAPILAGGRFITGGRLVSVLAAGISRVPLVRMLAVTIPVAALWTAWMTTIGIVGSAVAGHSVLGGPAAALVISAITTVCVLTIGGLLARRKARARAAFHAAQPVLSAQA